MGPVERWFLIRGDSVFDALLSLTLLEKFVRGQMPKQAVPPVMIVIDLPRFNDHLCLGERVEVMQASNTLRLPVRSTIQYKWFPQVDPAA